MFFAWNVRGLNSVRRYTMIKDWINIYRLFFGVFLEIHILEGNKERVLGVILRGWNFFVNYAEDVSGRIVFVWDSTVILIIYDVIVQLVICGVSIFSENIFLIVIFIYGFNLVEDRRCMWNYLVQLQDSFPVFFYFWSVVGDFNQMFRIFYYFNYFSL